jgi:DNA-binding transcriptional ArsR family regulator
LKQPTISHHLKLLRDAALIDCERHGLFAYYFVHRAALAELRAHPGAARPTGMSCFFSSPLY